MNDDARDFLNMNASYDRHPSAKFPAVGDTLDGRFLSHRKVTVNDQFKGIEVEKLVLEIETDDGPVALWLESGKRLTQAVADALKESGVEWFAEGGRIQIRRIDDIPPSKPGYQPTHAFKAKYSAPAPLNLDEF